MASPLSQIVVVSNHSLLSCQIILCSTEQLYLICLCIFFYFAIFVLHSVQVTIFTVKFPPPKKTKQTNKTKLCPMFYDWKNLDYKRILHFSTSSNYRSFSAIFIVLSGNQKLSGHKFPLAQNARPRMLRGSHVLVSDVITLKYIGAAHTLLLISSGFVTVCLNALIYYSLQSLFFFFLRVLLCFVLCMGLIPIFSLKYPLVFKKTYSTMKNM